MQVSIARLGRASSGGSPANDGGLFESHQCPLDPGRLEVEEFMGFHVNTLEPPCCWAPRPRSIDIEAVAVLEDKIEAAIDASGDSADSRHDWGCDLWWQQAKDGATRRHRRHRHLVALADLAGRPAASGSR